MTMCEPLSKASTHRRAVANHAQAESELGDIKNKVRQLVKRINRDSEPQASIESDKYTIQ